MFLSSPPILISFVAFGCSWVSTIRMGWEKNPFVVVVNGELIGGRKSGEHLSTILFLVDIPIRM
ncbi:hypothetical protein A2U01_0012623 [Trifolium medium]|uniref:Uncharacterized protein n=1 Tax=Trifolium medium TaxID=97028 RepID=A0A392MZL1_9FABA|nr:hypothetical protein [Trifolium medium]